MLQVTGTGKLFFDQERIPYLRDQFRDQHIIKLPSLIEDSILKRMLKYLETAKLTDPCYAPSDDGEIVGKHLGIDPENPAGNILTVLLNNSDLFKILEQITGVSPLRCFRGLVILFLPNADHSISWHSDAFGNNRIGISVNLSKEPFQGGVLQLRNKSTKTMLAECPNTELGDAVIFPISPDIEHRTTALEGSVARTTGSGWFRSEPDFFTMIERRQTEVEAGPAR